MNSTPPLTGRRYWRSLDELADTPEFKDWLHREFPQGASEMDDGQYPPPFPQDHVRVVRAGGLGTLGAGCRRPEENLEPFGKQPENYVFGEPQYFATAMPTRTGAIPLVVKSYEGRPDQNRRQRPVPRQQRRHRPLRAGFDPGSLRSRPRPRFTHDGKAVSRDEALKFLDELVARNLRRTKAKAWRFSPKAARRRRARGCKKSSRRNFRNRSGSPTTRLIPASISARPRRRSASR